MSQAINWNSGKVRQIVALLLFVMVVSAEEESDSTSLRDRAPETDSLIGFSAASEYHYVNGTIDSDSSTDSNNGSLVSSDESGSNGDDQSTIYSLPEETGATFSVGSQVVQSVSENASVGVMDEATQHNLLKATRETVVPEPSLKPSPDFVSVSPFPKLRQEEPIPATSSVVSSRSQVDHPVERSSVTSHDNEEIATPMISDEAQTYTPETSPNPPPHHPYSGTGIPLKFYTKSVTEESLERYHDNVQTLPPDSVSPAVTSSFTPVPRGVNITMGKDGKSKRNNYDNKTDEESTSFGKYQAPMYKYLKRQLDRIGSLVIKILSGVLVAWFVVFAAVKTWSLCAGKSNPCKCLLFEFIYTGIVTALGMLWNVVYKCFRRARPKTKVDTKDLSLTKSELLAAEWNDEYYPL